MHLAQVISPEVETVKFRTAGLVVHHDAGVVEAFSHDGLTTDRDWSRVCRELRKLGATLDSDACPAYEDSQGWMTWLGTF